MGLFKDLFGSGTLQKPAGPTGLEANNFNQPIDQPKKIDLRGGVYDDPSRFDPTFRHNVEQDLRGTLKSFATRDAVARLFRESRGGRGITKPEAKSGLNKLRDEGKLTNDQVRAVRRKYGIF